MYLALFCRLLLHEVHEGPGPPDIGEGNLAEPFQLGIGGIISGRPACGSCVPESIWRKEVQRMVRQLPVFVLARLCAIATGLVRPHVSPMLEKGILPSPPSLALSSNLVGRPACMPARHCKWLSKTTYEPHVEEGYLAKPFQLGIGSNLVRRPVYGSYIPESIWCKEVHGVLGQLPVLVLACLRANVSFSVALHMNLQARCG